MQSSDHRKLAFSSSLILALSVAVISALIDHFVLQQFHIARSIITVPLVFIGSFLVIRFVINDFIYSKIKLIYKTIHNLKTPSTELKNIIKEENDAIDTVNKEVVSWAETKQQEIESLRDQESYRREFLGNVSHELKTPIFNIQGYVHTLLDGGLEDDDINRKFLLRTDKSVERMISVVEDLEVISKLESGRIELEMERFNIVETTQEVLDSLEMKAAKRNVSIGFNTNYERPIYVTADAGQIRQIYVNLIDNAIKYGSEGGSIKLHFYDMDQNILCEVADNGPGIEKVHIPRLFERFYRVDKARDRNTGGTGLGLSIVKHIIDAHQQTINIRTETGENSGTTFSFTLKKAK
jgi:two-component system phosphate regulon sensor histidine kinase PhoR